MIWRGTYPKNKKLIFLLIVFGVIYSLISLVNHYCFRTYALDLGAYTNALYDYVHFQGNDSTAFKDAPENLLADHFDVYLILFSPLVLIFKSYTLLVVQIAFILIGGAGIHRYVQMISKNENLSIIATLSFLLFFGIFSAVSSDYHSNVVASMLIPWFFVYFKQKRWTSSILLFVFILVSKENVSLWMAFICMGMMIEYRKDRPDCLKLGFLSVSAFLYFIVITGYVMPALSTKGVYPHFNYSALGHNSSEALIHLISHPLEAFKMLFINHTKDVHGDHVKMELHLFLGMSGLLFLLFRPAFLFMLVPVFLQKLMNDNYVFWGISGQYSVEFAPVIILGAYTVIASMKNSKSAQALSYVLLTGILITTIKTMDATVMFTNKSRIRIYQADHYRRNYNVENVYCELNKIPDDAIVSAQSPFLPHLSVRDKIYQFPVIRDAEYLVFSPKEETYPLEESVFVHLTDSLQASGQWVKKNHFQDVIILKKINK